MTTPTDFSKEFKDLLTQRGFLTAEKAGDKVAVAEGFKAFAAEAAKLGVKVEKSDIRYVSKDITEACDNIIEKDSLEIAQSIAKGYDAKKTPAAAPVAEPVAVINKTPDAAVQKTGSEEVIALQKGLVEGGFKLKPTKTAPDGVDGIYGPDTDCKTRGALRAIDEHATNLLKSKDAAEVAKGNELKAGVKAARQDLKDGKPNATTAAFVDAEIDQVPEAIRTKHNTQCVAEQAIGRPRQEERGETRREQRGRTRDISNGVPGNRLGAGRRRGGLGDDFYREFSGDPTMTKDRWLAEKAGMATTHVVESGQKICTVEAATGRPVRVRAGLNYDSADRPSFLGREYSMDEVTHASDVFQGYSWLGSRHRSETQGGRCPGGTMKLQKVKKPVSNGGDAGTASGNSSGSSGNGGPGSGGCFIPGSMILMADGSYKAIELLSIGDVVKGDGQDNTVIATPTIPLAGRTLYGFNGGDAFVTAGHPFMTDKGWSAIDPTQTVAEKHSVITRKLEVGDMLVTQTGMVLVTSIDAFEATSTAEGQMVSGGYTYALEQYSFVYNPMLDGNHTYFANDYLVHNKN